MKGTHRHSLLAVLINFVVNTSTNTAIKYEEFVKSKAQICPEAKDLSMEQAGEYEGVLSKVISSRAVSQILDFFLDHKEFDYSPSEIANKTGLSFRTIFRELPALERNQLIYISRKIGKTSMYRLNDDFRATAYLEKFALEMSQLRPQKSETQETELSNQVKLKK